MITIIVLLILATISISALTGENGILTKANKAKEDTERESAREKVQMVVLASYDSNGDIDIATLKNELNKIGGTVTDTEGRFPVTVKVDGYTFVIDAEGKVTQGGSETEEIVTLGEEYLDFDYTTGGISLKDIDSYYDWMSARISDYNLGIEKFKLPEFYDGKTVTRIGMLFGTSKDSASHGLRY